MDAADFPEMTLQQITDKLNEEVTRVNNMLPAYKRIQDIFVSTEEFEINSTRKVIRSKVVEKYYDQLKK